MHAAVTAFGLVLVLGHDACGRGAPWGAVWTEYRWGAIAWSRTPARSGPLPVSCEALERVHVAAGGTSLLQQSPNTACPLVPAPIISFAHHPRGYGRSHAGLTGLWYPFSVCPSLFLSYCAVLCTSGSSKGGRGMPWCLTRNRACMCLARPERLTVSPARCLTDAAQLVYNLCLPRNHGGLPLTHRRHDHCNRPKTTPSPLDCVSILFSPLSPAHASPL